MNSILKFSIALFSLFTCSAFATNYQDLWWTPAESGWGLNITQQHDIIFATWFIYDADRTPLWLTMSRGEKISANTFSGPIYITSGPGFSGPFNPLEVTRSQVGTATVTFSDAKNGVLTYSVNGSNVSKNITRQTYREIPLNGTYIGGGSSTYTGCNFANGVYSLNETITVSTTGNNIVIREQSGLARCDSVGTFSQNGSMFQGSGTYSCNDGSAGTWVSTDMRANENSFVAKMETNSGTCRGVGSIGGVNVIP